MKGVDGNCAEICSGGRVHTGRVTPCVFTLGFCRVLTRPANDAQDTVCGMRCTALSLSVSCAVPLLVQKSITQWLNCRATQRVTRMVCGGGMK